MEALDKTPREPSLSSIRQYLREKQNLMNKVQSELEEQQEQMANCRGRSAKQREWGVLSKQRKLETNQEIMIPKPHYQAPQNQNSTEKMLMELSNIRSFEYDLGKNQEEFRVDILPSNKYYPPSCSGCDIVYCKLNDSIYIYGGISCSTQLSQGLQSYFYQYINGRWHQLRSTSEYCPMPRYGHTLTMNNHTKQIILFGGVSEYKEKLKDRCFYSDLSSYHVLKNKWKAIEASGTRIKNRKNHTACIYGKYYIVYGGIDDTEEVLDEINWISFEGKRIRWKNAKVEPRFNHRMACIQNENGREFLCVYGGRNAESDVTSSFLLYPIGIIDGDFSIRSGISLNHSISPREMPVMCELGHGSLLIMGGINESNEVVRDSWYYNSDKQTFSKAEMKLQIDELRGCRGVCTAGGRMFVLAGNSRKYKAIEIYK